MKLVVVVAAVFLLVLLVTKFKINTFIALIVTSFFTALTLQIPLTKITSTISAGIGSRLGELAIVLGLGSMFGRLIIETGGAAQISTKLIDKFGAKKMPLVVILAAFTVGLALFFEAGFVVLLPLVLVLTTALKRPFLSLALPLAAVLEIMQGFIPLQLTSSAVTNALHADFGQLVLIGLLCALPTIIITGLLFPRFLARFYPQVFRTRHSLPGIGRLHKLHLKSYPSFAKSLLTVMLPLILIGCATILKYALPNNSLNQFFQFIGQPEVALLLSLTIAIFTMGISQKIPMQRIGQIFEGALTDSAVLLFIIGGSGALTQVLVDGGLATYISSLFTTIKISPLLTVWLLAAAVRLSVGSTTTAALASATLAGPLLIQTASSPVLMLLALGTGSLFSSHVNDASFWLVKEYFGLTLKETFLSWTALTTLISVLGLMFVLALSIVM